MVDIVNVLFVMLDFAFASMNLYYGLNNNSNFSLSVSLFTFGMGILQTAIYLKEDK